MFLKIISIVVISTIVFASLWGLYLVSPKKNSKKTNFNIKKVKFAHRGIYDNTKGNPENSLAAFKIAVEKGYGIELDIRLTKDNEVVVFHDPTLLRMCGNQNRVIDMTFNELNSLTLLETNEKIPKFSDVLSLVKGRIPILVEYKAGLPGMECQKLCETANKLLEEYEGDYAIESFNYLVLKWYKENKPNISRGQLSMGMQCYEVALGKKIAKLFPIKNRKNLTYLYCNRWGRPNFISYRHEDINFVVKLNKLLGAQIACWTVNNKEIGEQLLKKYDCIIFENYLA